jgi:hypothetical protein
MLTHSRRAAAASVIAFSIITLFATTTQKLLFKFQKLQQQTFEIEIVSQPKETGEI